jgi:hypothetical protein
MKTIDVPKTAQAPNKIASTGAGRKPDFAFHRWRGNRYCRSERPRPWNSTHVSKQSPHAVLDAELANAKEHAKGGRGFSK